MATVPRAFVLAALLGLPSLALAEEAALLGHPALESGAAPVLLHLHLPGMVPDLEPRLRAAEGELGEVQLLGRDLVAVPWTAPAGTTGGTETLSLRYRDTAGERHDQQFTLPFAATPSRSITLRPAQPVLGPADTTLEIQISTAAWSQEASARRIQLTPSLGRLSAPRLAADGTATVTWTRPAGLDTATMLVVLATDAGAPSRALAALKVPVQVRRAASFSVPPDSRVVVTTGETDSPAVQASPAGTVGVEMVLDPRVTTATLTATTPFGVTESSEVPLPANAGPQAVLSPLPASVATDPTAPVPLVVAVDDGTGGAAQPPTVTVSAGTISGPPVAMGGGAWVVPWTPPASGDTALVSVDAAGKRIQQRVALHAPAPTVALAGDPARLGVGQRELVLTATARHPDESPWTGSAPAVGLAGGTRKSSPKSAGGGRFTMDVRKDTGTPGVFAFVEPPVATGAPDGAQPAELVAWIDAPPDQPTAMHLLRYAVVDAQGAGIAGVAVTAEVVGGTAELGEVKPTWDNGMSWTPLHPASAAPVTVALSAAGVSRTVSVMPGQLALPASGSPRQRALLARWQAAAPALWVGQEVPIVAAVVAPGAAPAAAPASPSSGAGAAAGPAATAPAARSSGGLKPSGAGTTWAPAWVRLSARWHPITMDYASKQDGSAAGPEESAWFSGALYKGDPFGGTGFGLGALVTFGDSPWQLDTDLRRFATPVGADHSFPSWEAPEGTDFAAPDDLYDDEEETWTTAFWRIGARYRMPLASVEGLHGWGALGLAHEEALLFTWQDRAPAMTEVALWGARLGAGLSYERKRLFLDAGLAELLAPWPVATALDLDLEVAVLPQLAVRGGLDSTWRSMRFAVDDSEVAVGDQIHGVSLGLVYTLR